MPWDFQTEVSIDCDEILEYVKDNKDWFLSELGIPTDSYLKSQLSSIACMIENTLNEYDSIRRKRDESINNTDLPEVQLYEELVTYQKMIKELADD